MTGNPAHDVGLLNQYFSTKTLFDVQLDCKEEARDVLEASLTDPAIQHAISSLVSLRAHLAANGGAAATAAAHSTGSGHDHSTLEYCIALRAIATNLSSQGPHALRSALLCCQIFISIEQARQNFAVMAQHMVQGLNIMREYRARPSLDPTGTTLLSSREDLPLLDVFLIKMFAAPCRQSEPPTPSAATAPPDDGAFGYPTPPQEPCMSYSNLRVLAPDQRAELNKIAASTLDFLNRASRVQSAADALQLLPTKTSLLAALQAWPSGFDTGHMMDMQAAGPEPMATSFLRLFHRILNVILLGAVSHSPSFAVDLQEEKSRLLEIADGIDERLKTFGSSRDGAGVSP
jgi:hypothetical protein